MILPTIKQLRYYVSLVEHGHFGKAAQACFVSQSAFSNAIRDLENSLGVQLVDRTNKRVTVTALGREFAERAHRVLDEIGQMVIDVQHAGRPLGGRLHLGVIPTIAPFLLPLLLPEVRTHYPDLQLYLYEGQTHQVYQRLMAGELDLVVVALPYDLPGVETMSLFTDPFLLAHRRNSSLIGGQEFEISQLPDESVLLLEDGHCLRDHALSACHITQMEKVSRIAASSLLTLIEMVDADLGVTFIPQMAVHSSLLAETDIETQLIGGESHRMIGLGWRSGGGRGDEFEQLGHMMTELWLRQS